MSKEAVDLRDRITRAEERLVAERSVRKTRHDQLFKFITQVHKDLEGQETVLRDLNTTLQSLNTTLIRMEDRVENQTKAVEALKSDTQDNRDRIKEINGSIRAIKWGWPILMTLSGIILTLFVANIDLRLGQSISMGDPEEVETEVETEVEVGVNLDNEEGE